MTTDEKVKCSPESEPEKRKTYKVDGVKVTANFFFSANGITAKQALENYIVRKAVKQIATSL